MDAEAAELAAAIADHQAGRLDHADTAYRRILGRNPQNANALHLLGVLASQQGRLQAAIELIGQAVEQAGRHPLMMFNLANVLRDQGQLPAAIEHYQECVNHDPRFTLAHLKLGESLCLEHREAEAVACFERALALDAKLIEGHFQLAGVLARLGQLESARRHYRRVLELDPKNFAAGNNLGAVCVDLADAAGAEQAYQQALAAKPDCVEAHFNLGSLCNKRQQYQTAEGHFSRAVALQPDLTPGHAALAETLHFQGRTEAARPHLRRAAALRPKSLVWQLRPAILCPFVFEDNRAIDEHRSAVMARLEELSGTAGQQLTYDVHELGESNCHPAVSWTYQGRDDLALKSRFADLFAGRGPARQLPREGGPQLSGLPRVGFVATAGKEGVFLRGMAGLIGRLDARRFRITVACAPAAVAACRAAIAHPAVDFLPLPKAFSLAIEALRAARFDVLYYWEIGSDAMNYFLPMFRLAPVQCTSWGWPVTSGIPQVDYFISSKLLEPADGETHYREKLVRLRNIPNYYQPPAAAPVVDRAVYGWQPDEHIYFCGQSPRKIQPDFDQLMAGGLRADPRGKVALIAATLDHVTEALRDRFARRLPDVAQRIQFVPRLSAAEYRGLAAAADVVLDTLHYSGGANSLYDTLAAGTPVVTLPGEFHRGRYTAAVCRLLGIDECIAASPEDYVRIAVQLASEPDFREVVQRKIRQRRELLFDNLAGTHELADFFEQAAIAAREKGGPANRD